MATALNDHLRLGNKSFRKVNVQSVRHDGSVVISYPDDLKGYVQFVWAEELVTPDQMRSEGREEWKNV